jgi:hypothetical protein
MYLNISSRFDLAIFADVRPLMGGTASVPSD